MNPQFVQGIVSEKKRRNPLYRVGVMCMHRFVFESCRLAIQLCVGYFPDGRARHRTFSLKGINPNATADDLAAVVRALAPLLAYPIESVRLVRKYALLPANRYNRPVMKRQSFPICEGLWMKYDIYLFDADDTLYDYDRAEEYALARTFACNGLAYSDEVRAKYRVINAGLWRQFERGEVAKSELVVLRFARLFGEIGVAGDPSAFNARYLVELGNGSFLIDGAYEVCKVLCEAGKKIYIVTNGVSLTQKTRVARSPIEPFISGLFVSEEVGFQKPQREYFDHVFANIPPVEKSKILIVGDSLTSDIQGGAGAGIDTCWFNGRGKENPGGIEPTYEITRLSEIASLGVA